MKSFNVLALNSNFQIVGIVAFINLQWSRKWHECGSFSLSVPIEQYSSDWKYIYTKDRPEIGEISQINYISQNGQRIMMISGYFLEKELDRMIVYPKNSTVDARDAEFYWDSPSMSNIAEGAGHSFEHVEGSADNVAMTYFNAFKRIDFWNYTGNNQATRKTFELDILQGTKENGAYKQSDHYRNGEKLGWKIYDILRPSFASYRIRFDFDNSRKYFDVLAYKDKTETSTQYNPIIFSTKYGNVINPNVVISENEYIDGIITSQDYTVKQASGDKTQNFKSVNAKCTSDAKGYFIYNGSSVQVNDYKIKDAPEFLISTLDSLYNTFAYKDAIQKDLASQIQGLNVKTINIEFDSVSSAYEYIEDFNIGDLVSLEIPEIKLSADVLLIGCYEVIEDGKWTLSLEFGTPILK